MVNERFERGLKIRKEVLGADYVEKSIGSADDFSADFQMLVTEYCWGDNWGRDGALTRRDRSLLNLAMLAVMNRSEVFPQAWKPSASRARFSPTAKLEKVVPVQTELGPANKSWALLAAARVWVQGDVPVGRSYVSPDRTYADQ
jgi:alkylhydroperoxidase/carboxymuconolactone decarboxylase family protein YurZ